MSIIKTVSLGAAAMLTLSAPAMADVKSSQVRHHDLDLSTEAGQTRLATRVKQAVKSVCSNPRAVSFAERQDLARCLRDASASAMPKLDRTVARYQETKRLAANGQTAIVGN